VVAPSGECLRGKDAGLVESNDSLPPGDDLKSHLQAQRPATSTGKVYLYFFIQTNAHTKPQTLPVTAKGTYY